MRCPVCNSGRLQVIDSRPYIARDTSIVRRRRSCQECQHRFNTAELDEESLVLAAVELRRFAALLGNLGLSSQRLNDALRSIEVEEMSDAKSKHHPVGR